jgi:hypothetical protein
MATPKIEIGENIHTWLPANVFKGTFDGKPAIHKYIEIYDDKTIDKYKASLEIYKSLSFECENICKLLDYAVEHPDTSSDVSIAWTTARTNWERRMEYEKNINLPGDNWDKWDMWKKKKEDLAKMDELNELEKAEAKAEAEADAEAEEKAEAAAAVAAAEADAEAEAKTNKLAWFNMKRIKIRITMEDCGTALVPMKVHPLMDKDKLNSTCFINTILQIAHDVLSAIICLNDRKQVHGDIKVENVVLSGLNTPAPSPPAAVDAAPSLPQQDTALCPMIKAKLIDMDSIGYIDEKRFTAEDTGMSMRFRRYFDIKNVLYNVPALWVANFRKNLTDQPWGYSKGYIDIFSWCIVCLHLLLLMGIRYFINIKDEKGHQSSFKNSVPDKGLSKSLEFVKAYIFESLISDMCLPDIKIGATPMDKSLNIVIDVEYCKMVKSFLIWLKDVSNMEVLSFPEKNRKKWWVEFKEKWRIDYQSGWSLGRLVDEPLGGGYNKSNRGRDTRKNKHRLSKRLKKRTHKRKYKRTHKRKYKRTHKRKYTRTHKRTHKRKY